MNNPKQQLIGTSKPTYPTRQLEHWFPQPFEGVRLSAATTRQIEVEHMYLGHPRLC